MARSQPARQPTQKEVQPVLDALNNGQLVLAEGHCKKLLKQFPQAFVLHNLHGNALAGQSKFKEAVSAFQKALEIDSSVAELHFNLAILLTNLNRTDEAIKAYHKTVKLNPSLTDAHYNLGTALQSQGEFAEASQAYEKAIQQQPGFFEAIANLGVCQQELGNMEAAADAYVRALNLNKDKQLYFNLGTVLKNQGKLQDAIATYNEALALDPDYAQVHSNIGEVLRDQGRYDESVAAFNRALELDPSLPYANYSLAVYYYDSGQLEKALDYFQKSQFADWQERSLYCLYKTGRYDEFKRGLDSLKKTRHNSPFLATLAGHYAENFGTENDYNFCKNPLDLVCHVGVPELKGDSELLQQLLSDIKQADIEEKRQGRLHNGVQSAGNLFRRPEASFQEVAKLVARAVDDYRERIKDEDCTFAKAFPKNTEFASSWYVRMRTSGHLTSHIHEEGWVSGALYLAMPTDKKNDFEGNIELSTHGDNYPKEHNNFPTATYTPEVGDIVMFPSSVFHRTLPFSSEEERICIAFDLKPAVD